METDIDRAAERADHLDLTRPPALLFLDPAPPPPLFVPEPELVHGPTGNVTDRSTPAPVGPIVVVGLGSSRFEAATEPEPEPEATGISPELLDRLRPYLAESIMVLDQDWTVKANLAPPGGLIGRGLGIGLHTMEDLHPDDAVLMLDLGLQAFDTEPGWQASRVVRMHRGDGTWGRYEITACNRFDDPVIAGMVVRTREVPEHLFESLSGLQPISAIETLSELLHVGVLLLDPNGAVIYANSAACGMLDREALELKRDGFADLVHPADAGPVESMLQRVCTSVGQEHLTVRLEGARTEWVELRLTSTGGAEVSSVVVTLEDITERRVADQRLEARANHDPLTGLRNRASLYELLDTRMELGVPTDVAYLDLNGFKAVNDTWGHARGDQVLVAVADALWRGLESQVPGMELARLGGDEFVIVGSPAKHEPLARGVRALVAEAAAAEGVEVTVSVGVALAQPGERPQDLLRRADAAMYKAKGTSTKR